jgi:hypothetical protein
VQRLETLERRLSGAAGPAPAAPAPRAVAAPAAPAPTMPLPSRAPMTPAPARPASPPVHAPAAASAEPGSAWSGVLAALEADKPALAATLAAAKLVTSPAGWTLLFAKAFDKDRAERDKALVEGKLKAAGCAAPLSFAVEEGGDRSTAAAHADPAEGDADVQKALGVFGGRVRPAPKKKP